MPKAGLSTDESEEDDNEVDGFGFCLDGLLPLLLLMPLLVIPDVVVLLIIVLTTDGLTEDEE